MTPRLLPLILRSARRVSKERVQPISRHDEWCNAELRRRREAREHRA